MNQSAEDAWYFSRDGQQSGPLTYAELKEKADEGLLMPRQDLVWKEGMTDWRPVGEIDGLFERKAPEPSANDSLAPPADEIQPGDPSIPGEWPGARRRAFLIGLFIFPFLWNFVMAFVLTYTKENTVNVPPAALLGLSLVPLVVGFYYLVQRFPNLGMSRFWVLSYIVPFLNLWTGYRSFACPAGYAYHKTMDGIGIFLAIVYWLWTLLWVGAIALIAAVVLGNAGNPEFQKEVRKVAAPIIEQYEKAKARVPQAPDAR